ncbi:hypothetical protein LguiA_023785 [Lonicera macranthoides]
MVIDSVIGVRVAVGDEVDAGVGAGGEATGVAIGATIDDGLELRGGSGMRVSIEEFIDADENSMLEVTR